MRIVSIFLTFIFLLTGFYGCAGSNENVVAEYGNYKITLDEFKEAYDKNLVGASESALDTASGKKDFLDLYVNYKMKLRDAEVRGFDEDPDIQKEIEEYTRTVGVPYVEEKFIVEPGIKELYEKRKTERLVKHILIRKQNREDDEAKKIAQQLLDSIKAGASFEAIAAAKSEDQFSKPDSGDIYWVTAGQTIPPFDIAVYNTPIGEVYPELVHTNFGYHIVKVVDEQPRKHQVRASHILATFNQDGEVDTAAALEKIKTVQQKLQEGESFEKLATTYSDDKGSAQNGGDLGYFERRKMVRPFDEAVFSLKEGEISDIVQTKFGFHIIKLINIKKYPSFEEEKQNLKDLYQKTYYPIDSKAYNDTLKQRYNFILNESILSKLKSDTSNLYFKSTYWESDLEKELGDSTLYTINEKTYPVNYVIKGIAEFGSFKDSKMTPDVIDKAVNEQAAKDLFAEKAVELKNGDTEFAQLMEDYRKGLYIFKLQEDEIWNKLGSDSTQLLALYEETKGNYTFPDRAAYNVIFQKDSSLVFEDYKKLQEGTDFDSLVNENSKIMFLRSKSGPQELTDVAESELASRAYQLENPGDISEPFKLNDGWYIVKLIEKQPERIKTFEEARSEVSSIWMERESKRLEKAYLEKLKDIYNPKIYYDKLSELDVKLADEKN